MCVSYVKHILFTTSLLKMCVSYVKHILFTLIVLRKRWFVYSVYPTNTYRESDSVCTYNRVVVKNKKYMIKINDTRTHIWFNMSTLISIPLYISIFNISIVRYLVYTVSNLKWWGTSNTCVWGFATHILPTMYETYTTTLIPPHNSESAILRIYLFLREFLREV